jgi:phosphoribosylformimino-5-aminoimidazole carboxamide ribotide isomerase
MILLPAIDLLDGAPVQLTQGERDTAKVVAENAAELAMVWKARGAKELHCVDLNAAFGDGNNRNALLGIRNNFAGPMQVGGGIRDEATLSVILQEINADRAVIGTRGIKDPEWLAAQAEAWPGKIILAVDGRGDDVVVKGWTEAAGLTVTEVLERTAGLPLAGYLYTNVNVEGKKQGLEWEPVKSIVNASDHPVQISGGISGFDDLQRLAGLGAAGAIVGMALYDGDIDFEAVHDSL